MALGQEIPLRMMLREENQLFRADKSRQAVAFALLRRVGSLAELVMVTNNLTPLHDQVTSPYHFYEGWLTEPQGRTVSAGVFNTDPQGKGMLIYRFDPLQLQGHTLACFQRIIITAEPQDGNRAPCTVVLG